MSWEDWDVERFVEDINRSTNVMADLNILKTDDTLAAIRKIVKNVPSGTNYFEHKLLYDYAMKLNGGGIVVECGSYYGSTTATLSLVCKKIGCKLWVFDSFDGLPEPEAHDIKHRIRGENLVYKKGQYSVSQDIVMENVRNYGDIESCTFYKGFFKDTMPKLPDVEIKFGFIDVDLIESFKTCLRHLWPRLIPGNRMYFHEATDPAFKSLVENKGWWNEIGENNVPEVVDRTYLPSKGSNTNTSYLIKHSGN